MIKIVKYKSRSSIKFDYDPVIIAMIRSVELKYYDNNQKLWTFPNTALDLIKDGLKSKGYEFDYEEFRPEAFITEKDDGLFDFKFNAFIDNIDIIKKLKCSYDSNEKKWTSKSSELEVLIEILNEANIKHTIIKSEPLKPLEEAIKVVKKGRPKQ